MPRGDSQNVGNELSDRPCVRQTRLYRQVRPLEFGNLCPLCLSVGHTPLSPGKVGPPQAKLVPLSPFSWSKHAKHLGPPEVGPQPKYAILPPPNFLLLTSYGKLASFHLSTGRTSPLGWGSLGRGGMSGGDFSKREKKSTGSVQQWLSP